MQELADKVVIQLEAGVKPWNLPWDKEKCGGPLAPLNGATGAHYHGINVLILGCDMRAFQSGDPRWCSYLQAQEKGWQVRKGAKSATIFFAKQYAVKDEEADDDNERTVRVLKHHAVFHFGDIEGVPLWKPPGIDEAPWRKPEAAEIILKNSNAVIRIGGEKAFYSPSTDHIQLPPEAAFNGAAEWACTALHELGHWTGHGTRLNREEGMKAKYGSAAYAMEELRAELSSAFIAGELGIPADIPQHASYIDNWLGPLKKDKREIFRAAADAQKIVDMVMSFHPDFAAQIEPQPDRPSGPPQQQPEERPAA